MLQGLIYAVISATAFGVLAILVKVGYQAGLTGSEMMQYRFGIGSMILLAVLLIKDRSLLKIPWRGLFGCAFIGMVVYWLQTSCFVNALATIPASTAALVLYVHPVTVAILSAILLKMTIDRVLGSSLGLVMVGCCLVFYDAFLKAVDGTGMLYAIGAMAFFSCYLILVQVLLKGIRPLTATFYVMLFASVSFSISGTPSAWFNHDWHTMTIALSLGVIPGAIAVTFLYMAIEKVGSAYACIFSSIEPIVTLLGAAFFLEENVVLLQIGGCLLIVIGIVIPNIRALVVSRRLKAAA